MLRRLLRIAWALAWWRVLLAAFWLALTALDVNQRLENAALARDLEGLVPRDAAKAREYRERAADLRQRPQAWLIASYLVLAGYALWPIPRRWRAFRRAERTARGLCPACGYDLRATRGRCPECGAVARR